MSGILTTANKFIRCKSGNFAAFTALAILPFFAMMGGALDISRLIHVRSTLQNATEAAVLSAASLEANGDVETIIQQLVEVNVPEGGLWDTLQVEIVNADIALNAREIEISASVEVQSAFLKIAGIGERTVTASSVAVQSATDFEIAMVLDISSSMSGNRLSNLQSASKEFVDQIIENNDAGADRVSFSIVPYGGTVNIGDLYVSNSTAIADPIVATDPDIIVDPGLSDYYISYDLFDDKTFLFSDGTKCLEYPLSDYHDGKMNGPNSQVPHFWKYRAYNPWCPTDESAVLMNTNDIDAIHDRLDGLTLSDGTGTDIGVLWGAKALSPDWQGDLGGDFPNRPVAYDDANTIKIMVLMTDGGITSQFRPRQFIDGLENDRARSNNQQNVVAVGNYNKAAGHDSAYGRQKMLCEELEANGVRVYTIGFQIGETSSAAKQMEDCAVNGGNYYLVDSLDISEAFQAISASISNLRVSG